MATDVLIADHNAMLRQGLRSLLASYPEFNVVAESSDGRQAAQRAFELAPGLVLLDSQLPGLTGIQAMVVIKRRLPSMRVIMLTNSKAGHEVREALRAGADGYVLKDASFEELLIAMRSVMLGKKYLSPDVSCELVDSYLHPHRASADRTAPLAALTSRERSILQLVAEGRTNRTAAEVLSVSPKTVEKHRASLMRKLGLRSATELALRAIELGLIERPDLTARATDPGRGAMPGVSLRVG